MPPPVFSLSYDDRQIRQGLADIADKLDKLNPVLEEIGNYMVLATDIRFEREEDPTGEPWRKLSAYTIRLKQQQRRIQKILQSTGRLRDSINYRVSDRRLVVGTNVRYAAKHQLGQEGLAKRSFLGVSKADRSEIISIINQYFRR